VVLVDPHGAVFLPIFIGEAQVDAIESRLRRRSSLRPMTHDLLDEVIRQLGGRVVRVEITRLDASTFIGSIVLRAGERTLEIDARSSDAIVVSLGERVPVYVAPAVVEAAGIRVDEPVETGVPGCDRYLARYLRCVDSRAPLVDRVILRAGVRQQGELMREASDSEAERDAAAEACAAAEAQLEGELGHDVCWTAPLP
jgi:bifunctional DNase/RNase